MLFLAGIQPVGNCSLRAGILSTEHSPTIYLSRVVSIYQGLANTPDPATQFYSIELNVTP